LWRLDGDGGDSKEAQVVPSLAKQASTIDEQKKNDVNDEC
jgi:hypothetical protein